MRKPPTGKRWLVTSRAPDEVGVRSRGMKEFLKTGVTRSPPALLKNNLVDQGPETASDVDAEVVAVAEEVLRLGKKSDTSRCSRHNDSTGGKRCPLGQVADQLRDAEDQITASGEVGVRLSSSR